jgi:GNAT superfamily N-acetyltransferase
MKPIMPDGEVAGLVVWAFGGLSTCLRARMLLLLQLLTLPTKRKLKSRIKRGKRTEMKCRRENQKQRPRPKELGEITNASMQEWQTRLMPPGSCCMVLVAISVLREYQGQGIGSALIKWRTEITDSEGVYCWVSSSDKGWRAFQKMGFREVGRLSVDLDGFADEGLRNELREDGKWGTTIFVTCVGSSTFAYRHLKRGFGFRS